MQINEFCKIRDFLIRYKFYIKFLGPKISGKICREKISITFFKTINGLNIGILNIFIEENEVSYNLVYENFNKSSTCDCKIIFYKKKNFDPFS